MSSFGGVAGLSIPWLCPKSFPQKEFERTIHGDYSQSAAAWSNRPRGEWCTEKEFPGPFGVKRADGTLRLFWCTEKPHSMVHWASNRRTVGRPRTISTNVTESRMKTAVKTKAKKTNNQASFGGSILKANMEVEAAIQLAHDLDETGMPCVCIGVNCRLCRLGSSVHSAPTAHFSKKVCFQYALSLHKVCRVCTFSAPSLHITRGFFWGKPPGDKNAHLMHTFYRLLQTSCRYYAD